MKSFLTKVVTFFAIISVVLFLLYSIFDQEHHTIGDVRYVKTLEVHDNPGKFNSVLIGSSRVFDLGDLKMDTLSLLNYGIVQGVPRNYPDFLSYVINRNPINTVLIGLDFYGSSKYGINDFTSSWESSADYINKAESQSFVKSITSLYSFSRFKRLVNYTLFRSDPFKRSLMSARVDSINWNTSFIPIYERAYENYEFDTSLYLALDSIKLVTQGLNVKVFITPISEPLFNLLTKEGLQIEYERFLRICVSEFGEVYNLMELNEFTRQPKNFKDINHIHRQFIKDLVVGLLSEDGAAIDFPPGTWLNPDNIEEYIKQKKYIR